jgi:hypothetical protein
VLPALGFYPLPFEPAELASLRSYIHIRGDVQAIGPTVAARWPGVFDATFDPINRRAHAAQDPPGVGTGVNGAQLAQQPTRRDLADWLTDPHHPLTARVWVNRLWHYHFGRGIVATPGDFGVRGERPTHPELLDWLASELVDCGWSTKYVQRRIVQSAAYRQGSGFRVQGSEGEIPQSEIRNPKSIDPDNRFFWHFTPRRLEAEAVRDCILAASGELMLAGGGPSVPPEDEVKVPRRSVYLYQKRGAVPDHQKLFDGPVEMAESCEQRYATTTALQPLFLLNSEFVLASSRKLAERVRKVAQDQPGEQVDQAFRLTLGRLPADDERKAAVGLLSPQPGTGSWEDRLALLCQALLNVNEFVYLE